MDNPRDLALFLLNRQAHNVNIVNNSLEDTFGRHPGLDNRDRAFILHLVQGVLRWRRRLDWIIEQTSHFPLKKISPIVLNILRLSLYQIFFMDRIPESAAVNEAVKQAKKEGARHIVSFVNGMLRNICERRNDIDYPDPDENLTLSLSVFYSYPEWLVNMWLKKWGREFTEALLSSGNRLPTLTLRANRLKLDRSELIKRLEGEGVKGTPTPYSPDGILLEDFKGRVDELVSFKEGLFQVQDQAAQITSHFLKPEPGQIILDVCAGLGGKSTHLAELMDDRGQILALDISHRRLLRLVKTTGRLSIRSVRPVVADGSGSLVSLLRIRFDGVVVDAPCSGLGVLSRHPDGKWNRSEVDLSRLASVQRKILDQASKLLKSGGRMLYITCTISEEENERVVQGFLAHNKSLRLKNMKEDAPAWGGDLIDRQGLLRTFPHEHDMDGFFAALFTKK